MKRQHEPPAPWPLPWLTGWMRRSTPIAAPRNKAPTTASRPTAPVWPCTASADWKTPRPRMFAQCNGVRATARLSRNSRSCGSISSARKTPCNCATRNTPNSLTSPTVMTPNTTMASSAITRSASKAMSRYAILRRALSSSGLGSSLSPPRGEGVGRSRSRNRSTRSVSIIRP